MNASDEQPTDESAEPLRENRGPPDPERLGTQAGSPDQLAALLRADQRQRWQRGERILAEEYLERFPELAADRGATLDLVYGEYLLREECGEHPQPGEYLRRFPALSETLHAQFELHLAIEDTASRLEPASQTSTDRAQETAKPISSDQLPEWFGRYHILSSLGRGGMGVVYLAHDTKLDRRVALKAPRLDPAGDPNAIERFHREARAAAALQHPNLCPVYDVGEFAGVHYLTMPILSGELLSDWLAREAPLSPVVAAQITIKLARAMQAAHDASVVHRDLKPQNIVLNERHEPIVLDFGLARRSASGELRITNSGDLLGTPAYAAPEQIGADPAMLGPRSDIYSLGAILYEMLTGEWPFKGSLSEVLRKRLTEDPPPPSVHRPDLPPELDAICLKALAREPDARFSSMTEFAETLEQYDHAGGAEAPLSKALLPAGTSANRQLTRRCFTAGFTTLAVLTVGLWWLPRLGEKPPAAEDDPFGPGAVWSGVFRFRPPIENYTGEVHLRVIRREANRFEAVYSTEGRYEWNVAGTISGDKIRWDFTRATHEAPNFPLVGRAYVDGHFTERSMQVTFYLPGESAADMTLYPIEPPQASRQ